MTTYTVLNSHGDVQDSGLDLAQAAQTVMQYDGHEFEIRAAEDGPGFELWTTTFSRNSPAYRGLTKSRIFSLFSDEARATEDIYNKVTATPHWWCNCEIVTDADYAARLAEAAE